MIIARYYEREAVKRELRSRGIKLQCVEAGELLKRLINTSTITPRS
jgi:hypothetical protein